MSLRLDGLSLYLFFSVFYTLLCFHCLLPSKWNGEALVVLLCASSVFKLIFCRRTEAKSISIRRLTWQIPLYVLKGCITSRYSLHKSMCKIMCLSHCERLPQQSLVKRIDVQINLEFSTYLQCLSVRGSGDTFNFLHNFLFWL